MNVKSEPGRGTTFEIYLPCATIVATPPTQLATQIELLPGNGETILLVDDELALREMISVALTERGYRVLTAANGAEALVQLNHSAETVRLVLLDQDMPVMDGDATLAALRMRWPKLPVIRMSGELDAHRSDRPELCLGVAPLSKPFQLQQLLRTVFDQLGGGKN